MLSVSLCDLYVKVKNIFACSNLRIIKFGYCYHLDNVISLALTQSGLGVKAKAPQLSGCGFKSRHYILDGCEKNEKKGSQMGPTKKKK